MALTQVTGGLIASGQTITTPTISGYINLATWTTGTRPGSPTTGQAGFNTTLGVLETYNGTAWVSGGGLNLQSVQTTGFTAVAGNIYPCNTTSAAFTVTLPASPTAGNQVQIIDYTNTFAINALTIGRNGSNINGVANNINLVTNSESITFIYVDSTQGWIVSNGFLQPIAPNAPYAISYLIFAGGGSGAGSTSGGGGAGGYLTGTTTVSVGTNYSLVVGAGGASVSSQTIGNNGTNSTGFSLTAIGGGRGAGSTSGTTLAGSSGGSGGGGGGGAGANTSSIGSNATVNTGGGGGGGWNYAGSGGGAGGSGIIIISVPTANYSGTSTGSPTITTSGANTILQFTASGSYTA